MSGNGAAPAAAELAAGNGAAPATAEPAAPVMSEKERRLLGRRASYREGAVYSGLTFGSVAVWAFIGSIANSRQYGVALIGEYALAMSTLAIVRLLSTAKERPALVRQLASIDPRDPLVTGLFVATLAFSTVLTIIVAALVLLITHVLLNGPINRPGVFLPAVVIVIGYCTLGNVGENIDVIFNGYRAAQQTFYARLHTAIAFVVISVVFGVIDPTIWGLVLAVVGSMLTSLIHRVYLIRRFMRFSLSRKSLDEAMHTLPAMIRFGLQITPGAFADGGSNTAGTWIVASFNSIDIVGAYGRAWGLVAQLSMLNTRTNEMLFPTLVERRMRGDGPGFSRALLDSLRYTSLLLLLPAVACAGVTDQIMRIFGPGFEKGAGALAVLLFVPPLLALTQMQRQALYSLERPVLGSFSGLLRFGSTVVAALLLTWQLGATGAALGMVIGLLVDMAFSSHFVGRKLETPARELWPIRQRLGMLAACIAGYLVSRYVGLAVPFPFSIVGGVVGGAATFIAILLLTGGLNERDIARYRDARRKLAKRRRLRVAASS